MTNTGIYLFFRKEIYRLLLGVLLVFLSCSAHSDSKEGWDAFKKDDYEGVESNFLPLAQDGDPEAQYMIGNLYRNKNWAKANDEIAAQWLMKAAEQGHKTAQLSISYMYKQGLGLPRNLVESDRWNSLFMTKYHCTPSDGSRKYEGECYGDDIANGRGIMTWPNGARYEGAFVSGKMHGKGIMTWGAGSYKGDRYEGDFVDGKRTGKGLYLSANGNRFEGDFVDGKYIGKMASTDSSSVFQGIVPIPDQYLIKTKSGCRFINPSPVSNESVTWSGKCKDGFADGAGHVVWYKDGSQSLQSESYFENGFYMDPVYNNDLTEQMIVSSINSRCGIVLPISGVNRLKDLFDVRFDGKCPEGGGTLIHDIRETGSATILFQGKPFATYKGSFARRSVPVGGMMTFYTGSKFIFTDKVDFAGILTSTTISDWVKNIELVRSVNKVSSPNLDAAFNIKIGFNSKPTEPQEHKEKLLFFSSNFISAANVIKVNHLISPSDTRNLVAKSYKISLKIELRVKETSSFGGWGTGPNLRSIFKIIDIDVVKDKGYQSTGETIITELQSYVSGMGGKTTFEVLKPSVSIISITPGD